MALVWDFAEVMEQARSRVWCDAQLHTLDELGREVIDHMTELDPAFDGEKFARLARLGQGRMPQLERRD